MSEAKITSKGQITIPADIRQRLGLNVSDRVSFTPMPDGTVVMRARNRSIMELKGMIAPAPGTKVSIQDMRMDRD